MVRIGCINRNVAVEIRRVDRFLERTTAAAADLLVSCGNENRSARGGRARAREAGNQQDRRDRYQNGREGDSKGPGA